MCSEGDFVGAQLDERPVISSTQKQYSPKKRTLKQRTQNGRVERKEQLAAISIWHACTFFFDHVDLANQCEAQHVSRSSPGLTILSLMAPAILAALGKLTTRDVTRFFPVTDTNETVRY